MRLGVTLWKMETSQPADPPSVREIVHPKPDSQAESQAESWTPVRLPPGHTFQLGDKFQAGIESSRTGFIYVVNRALREDGSAGPAFLIFPTARIHGGDNRVWPGRLVRLPDRASTPPFWTFESARPDYAGELFILLFTPQPIPDLAPQEHALPLEDSGVASWNQRYGRGVNRVPFLTQALRLTPEEAAARDQGVQLVRTAPLPQVVYEGERAPDAGMLATMAIRVSQKP
jgi:hypothetical protein